MARRAQLPALLGSVHPRTRVPLPATILAGTMVLLIALLVPFEFLLVAANAFTLFVFLLVDVALWCLHKRDIPSEDVFHVPRWLPPVATALVIILIASEFIA
jgi:amino acid transporter